MLELLIAFGLPLLLKIGIGDIISLAGLAKGLIGRIGEKDALGILKKALDETIKKSEDDKAKAILKNLKKNEVLCELQKFDVSEESKKSLVSQYFNGRADVFEDLAKNYYELFCKEATKKDKTFKEFVVIELGKLASQGIVTNEAVIRVENYLEGIKTGIAEIKEDTTEIQKKLVRLEKNLKHFLNLIEKEQRERIKKIKTSWLRRFLKPFENAMELQNRMDYSKSKEMLEEILEDIEKERPAHIDDKEYITTGVEHEVNSIETLCFFNLGVNTQYLEDHLEALEFYENSISRAERLGFTSDFIAVNYNNRGVAYAELNKHENAIEDYNKAIKLNRDYAEAYYNRGVTYYELKQPERTIKDFDTGIGLNPNYAEAYWNRSIAYLKIGKYKEAAKDLKKAGILLLNSERKEEAIKVFSVCRGLRGVKSDDVAYCGLIHLILQKPPVVKPITSVPDALRGVLDAYHLTPQQILELKQRSGVEQQPCASELRIFKYIANLPEIKELSKMQMQDETLRKIFELTRSKLINEDISKKITAIENKEEREEMIILLDLLKRL